MNSKNTKRALASSALAMLLCIALLVGTTFAWFTDTASTSVNKIQSGNLDVQLVKEDGLTELTEALKWVKAAGTENEKVLWEPGASYDLEGFKVKNNGNLALKYKVVISGIVGDNALKDAIDFTMKSGNGAAAPLADFEGHLSAGATTDVITINGKMKETAGNEYMNKTVNGIAITVIATQYTEEHDSFGNTYDENAEYPVVKNATLEEAFDGVDFGYGNTADEAVSIDGKGITVIDNWTDSYFNSDTTVKGVTFKNGASITAQNSNITVTFEDCTFYACDQQLAAKTLGITDENGTGNNGRNNILTNSGAGMCLNLEQKNGTVGVKFVVKNCTFIGENDETLPVYGNKYNGKGSVDDKYKKRGHAIVLNAISGGGTAGVLDSMTVEGCTMSGVRGNAIQLYGSTGNITIKDTKINFWGVNSGAYVNGSGQTKDADSAAIRGDFTVGGARTLTLENVYFGLNENSDEGHAIKHVNVGAFPGNTDGTRAAGTY